MENHTVFHPDGVEALFPTDTYLRTIGARNYLAVPIHNARGDVVGHLGALDTEPMQAEAQEDWILRVFAARAGLELERLHAEERLRESEARARTLLESHFDGVVLVVDGRIVYANRALWQLAGFPSAEALVGRSPEDFVVAAQREQLRQQMADDLSGNGTLAPTEYLGVTIDGSTVPVEVLGRRIDFEGSPAILAAVRDITERKQVERERRELEHQLAESQGLCSVGQLAAGVAHNFNNALTAIYGYSELLARRFDATDPTRKDLEQIKRVAEQSARLTRQLLAFSRTNQVRPSVFCLNEAIETTRDLLSPLIGNHIEIRLHLDRALPDVNCDRTQMEEIITNLVLNARDAMPDGGAVTIGTGVTDVDEADCRTNPEAVPGRYVRLTVIDTGTGMDEETVARVFEPFFTTKGPGEGVGLALAMLHGAITQAGGFVTVKSDIGVGSTFALYIPAQTQSG